MKNDSSPLDAIIDDPSNAAVFANEKATVQAPSENGRIIAGFEEINAFVDTHGFVPGYTSDGREADFIEDALAARLETLQSEDRYKVLLEPYDRHSLLGAPTPIPFPTTMEEVLALDHPIFQAIPADEIFNITNLPQDLVGDERAEYDAATRVRCANFSDYEPVFARLKAGLIDKTLVAKREIDPHHRRGTKTTVLGSTDIQPGTAFILNGIIAYVVSRDDGVTRTVNRVRDAHLHIVFENGTESSTYLLRSFARVLFEDESGSQIVSANTGFPVNINASHVDLPIFGGDLELADEDVVTGQIYVVKSLSTDAQIKSLDGKLFKIGFTTQKIESRIANAAIDPTFLCAPVEIVTSYTVANTRTSSVEKAIHTFFGPARLRIYLHLGRKVEAKEWFVVPLDQVKAAIPRIADRTIAQYSYDKISEKLVPR